MEELDYSTYNHLKSLKKLINDVEMDVRNKYLIGIIKTLSDYDNDTYECINNNINLSINNKQVNRIYKPNDVDCDFVIECLVDEKYIDIHSDELSTDNLINVLTEIDGMDYYIDENMPNINNLYRLLADLKKSYDVAQIAFRDYCLSSISDLIAKINNYNIEESITNIAVDFDFNYIYNGVEHKLKEITYYLTEDELKSSMVNCGVVSVTDTDGYDEYIYEYSFDCLSLFELYEKMLIYFNGGKSK